MAIYRIERTGRAPLIATAIHAGHAVRAEVALRLAPSAEERRREEDAYTDRFTVVGDTRVVALRSRFEVDLNRPRQEAVYRTPDDAFGLEVWKHPPPPGVIARSLLEHDAFYAALHGLLSWIESRYRRFVVLDLHSYNHRRAGPAAPPDDPAGSPEVNVGTGSLDRSRWGALVDRFLTELGQQRVDGPLDVRENVRFRGRRLAAFVHERFPRSGCCLAVEFKKTYVDEWTGALDEDRTEALIDALAACVPGLLAEAEA